MSHLTAGVEALIKFLHFSSLKQTIIFLLRNNIMIDKKYLALTAAQTDLDMMCNVKCITCKICWYPQQIYTYLCHCWHLNNQTHTMHIEETTLVYTTQCQIVP